jgi:hypothetical protein
VAADRATPSWPSSTKTPMPRASRRRFSSPLSDFLAGRKSVAKFFHVFDFIRFARKPGLRPLSKFGFLLSWREESRSIDCEKPSLSTGSHRPRPADSTHRGAPSPHRRPETAIEAINSPEQRPSGVALPSPWPPAGPTRLDQRASRRRLGPRLGPSTPSMIAQALI